MKSNINWILKNQETITFMAHSDLHAGTRGAIKPTSAKIRVDGIHYEPDSLTSLQKGIWKFFIQDLKAIKHVNVVINLGDSIDGQELKSCGLTLADSDPSIQKDWAVLIEQKVIDMLKPTYYLGVAGTDFHVGSAGNADLEIYKRLQEANPDVIFIYGENLVLKIGKLVWNLTHAFPTVENMSGASEKLIRTHAYDVLKGNTIPFNVNGYGHAHVTSWNQPCANTYSFVTPCQQPTSKYGRSKPYLQKRKPDVGMLYIKQFRNMLSNVPYVHPEIHALWS